MINIRRGSFDQITMKAKGQDATGRPVDLELTWAWAPDLSAYNVTDRCWLGRDEWRFVEEFDDVDFRQPHETDDDVNDEDDPELGLHGDMGPGAPVYR